MLLRTSKSVDWMERIEPTVQSKVGIQEKEACPPTRANIPVIIEADT
jgi:hypothetical protein